MIFLNLFELDSLGNVEGLGKDINSKYHEATATISKDGKTLYFTRNNYFKGKFKKSKKNAKGTITPTMCVDKLPNEIADYSALVKEADSISKDWDFVFISSLSGVKGLPPTTEDADPYLNKMTNDITSGQNISRYVIFDRQDNPIELLPN